MAHMKGAFLSYSLAKLAKRTSLYGTGHDVAGLAMLMISRRRRSVEAEAVFIQCSLLKGN